MYRTINIVFSFCVLSMVSACGLPEELELPPDPPASREQAIVNGQTYNGHPQVGQIIVPMGGQAASCTATLIGKHTVLTAAHCVFPGQSHQFKLAGATYTTTLVVRHPQYGSSSQGAENDIALMKLSSDPPVTPSEVSRSAPFQGQKLTLIGFGVTYTNGKDSGVKRIAYNDVYQVTSTKFTFTGASGSEGNTCSGDSGGPAFATVDGKEVHLGIHSMATNPCGSMGINTRTDAYYDWLKQQSGGDLYEQVPDVENPKVTITAPLSGAAVRQDFSVKVSATDDRGVQSIELLLDGQSRGTQSGGQATFALTQVAVGSHTLAAVAKDAAGHSGQAQVQVTVVPPKDYGAQCTEHLDCKSVLCAGDPGRGLRFCSQICDPALNGCPQSAPCLSVAGTASMFLCGLPGEEDDGGGGASGSCSLTPTGRSGPGPAGAALLLLLVVGLGAARRHRR